ncbi:MAG: cyclase family protein [Ignavibacteria bacterium]
MELKFTVNNKEYKCDSSTPLIISIPMIFNGDQPNTYDVKKATAKAYEKDGFIGDTRKGGGCNFEQCNFIAHCNGTHTECVGHISLERISIHDTLKDSLIASTLITVNPEKAFDATDQYIPEKNAEDLIITKSIVEKKINNLEMDFLEGLIIRTLPNDDTKKSRRYMENQAPYFSIEAMEYIVSLNVKHLLIDLPSVDRTFDDGKLTAHHIFWNVPFDSHDINIKNHSMKTITEMIYASKEIEDGKYLLNIQFPEFEADAAPSRILLYELKNVD